MKRYYFDPETREYMGEARAPIDPRETQKQGKPVYLEHPNATFDPPPEITEGKRAIFRDRKWTLEDVPLTSKGTDMKPGR